MENNELSITCPNCGKLNVLGSRRCSNCGHLLPSRQQSQEYRRRPLSKRTTGIVLTAVVMLALVLLGIIIQHNQVLSYTTFLNSAPQKVVFYDAGHHPRKTIYLIGDQRRKATDGVQGTLVIARRVHTDKNYRSLKSVPYTDSRQSGSLMVRSDPAMKFYYPGRMKKLKSNGQCKVAGHPEIKYFSWQTTSGGVTR